MVMAFLASNILTGQDLHPSKWPKPNMENIKGGFYTKEKLMEYRKWKRETLPDLYLLFDSTYAFNKLIYLEWEDNFQYRFNYCFESKATNTYPCIHYHIDDRPKKSQ